MNALKILCNFKGNVFVFLSSFLTLPPTHANAKTFLNKHFMINKEKYAKSVLLVVHVIQLDVSHVLVKLIEQSKTILILFRPAIVFLLLSK